MRGPCEDEQTPAGGMEGEATEFACPHSINEVDDAGFSCFIFLLPILKYLVVPLTLALLYFLLYT
jgi:hypothetical protein